MATLTLEALYEQMVGTKALQTTEKKLQEHVDDVCTGHVTPEFPTKEAGSFCCFPVQLLQCNPTKNGKKKEGKVSERIMKIASFHTCLLSPRRNTTLLVNT